MEWLILTGAAAEAVSQVLVVVACGIILSRTGYLSHSAQKSISQVNLYFMTPCLLFTKIASTITWQQFVAFWPIPVFFLLFSGVSWLVARIGSKILRFSSDEEKFVKASVMFCNTNSLPMALIQSLAMSAAGSRLLRDDNDTMEQVAARGISYILFYAIFGNLVRWSYGFSLLVPKDAEEQTVVQENQEVTEYTRDQVQPADGVLVNVDESQPVSPEHVAAASSASSMRTLGDESDEADEEEPISGHDHSNFFRSAYKSKSQKLSTHMQQLSPPVVRPTREFQTLLSSHQHHRRHNHHRRQSARSLIKQKASTAFDRIRQVLAPPLLTAIIALVVGLIPALHKFFMGHDSKFYSFIIHPIENCGAAAIPMILLCLGAQVVHFATTSNSSNDSNSTILEGGDQPQRRRSFNAPSVFPHAHQVSESSSSDEDNQDQGWFRVQSPPRRNIYGRRRSSSSSHFNPSSSTTTLFQSQLSDDDEIAPLQSAFNGASELGLRGHRFKWLTPVVYVLFSRMVLVPLICLPAILFHPDTLSPILTMDPTFSLTLVLISASPTAINMIQLCQIKGFFENDMAAVLFWSYCVLGIPCILGWSLVGLWAAGR